MQSPSFRSFALDAELLDVVEELGFEAPTSIQVEAIPRLLEGRDVIAQSRTGSGKTTAFALPLLQRIRLSERAIQALVLCPTRELATQVAREIRKLGRKRAGLAVLVVAGGAPARPQLDALGRGVHVVVGTPGRVVDFLDRGALDLRSVTSVVLDEADRMLEMGFAEPMKRILGVVPKARQTALFSATFPPAIETMSRSYQREPVRITGDAEGEALPAVRHVVHRVEAASKIERLLDSLAFHPHESALVFCNLKATVAEVETALRAARVSVAALHGDLEQSDRDRVMARFRNHSVRVVVATDVAARGIDVDHLDLVVNLDVPAQVEVYVHRIGRTGRAGRGGLAITLTTEREARALKAIEAQTGVKLETAPLPSRGTGAALVREARMETLFISGGRKEKVRPGDILGALTGEAGGLAASDVGKIEIHDHFAYVAVARSVAARALASLEAGKIKGRRFRVGYAR